MKDQNKRFFDFDNDPENKERFFDNTFYPPEANINETSQRSTQPNKSTTEKEKNIQPRNLTEIQRQNSEFNKFLHSEENKIANSSQFSEKKEFQDKMKKDDNSNKTIIKNKANNEEIINSGIEKQNNEINEDQLNENENKSDDDSNSQMISINFTYDSNHNNDQSDRK